MHSRVFILRPRGEGDEEPEFITDSEWRSLVEADPTMKLRAADPRIADWKGECQYGESMWFAFHEEHGVIYTKSPDEPILAKMLEMAAELNAEVRGEGGETYVTPTEVSYPDPYHQRQNNINGSQFTILGLMILTIVSAVAVAGALKNGIDGAFSNLMYGWLLVVGACCIFFGFQEQGGTRIFLYVAGFLLAILGVVVVGSSST